MITWTPEAEQTVYDYLNEVSRLAAIRGENGAELQSNLMEHIRSEVAERGLEFVTEDIAREIVAQLGDPEEIVGEPVGAATPPPVPTQAAPPPPATAKRGGMRWFSPPGCLITLVIGLVIAIIIVPIMAIITAILLPALSRARLDAQLKHQQTVAQNILSGIVYKEVSFQDNGKVDRNKDGIGDYGTIDQLNAYFKQDDIPFEEKGYAFHVDVVYGDGTTPPAFHCTAKPLDTNSHQKTQYYVDQTGVIRYTRDGVTVPNESAPPLKTVPSPDMDGVKVSQ